MCKGMVQRKRHACIRSSDFRYNNIKWKISQVVHNFVQFKVQTVVCKRGQVSHIQKLIIAFVPVFSDHFICNLLCAFK